MSTHDAARIQPALQALMASDAAKLEEVIERDPGIVHTIIGDNTLLELATQPAVGEVSSEVIAVLINRGAKLDRALNLAACWNLSALVEQLLKAGADPRARADADITPLESAAMHGSAEAADILAAHGIHRNSLWLAAAAGQLDLVRSWVDESSALLKPPGPYRPNLADIGRPAGAPPTQDPKEILGESFVFAAANGRTSVVDYLLEVGVSIDARPYRNTTALHLAIQFGKAAMVQHLIERGASTAIEDDTYHSDALGWAQACDKGNKTSAEIHALLRATPSTL